MFSLGNNSFTIGDIEEKNVDNRDSTYRVKFTFSLQNYAVGVNDEIYCNLFLNDYGTVKKIEKNRMQALYYKTLRKDKTKVKLKIGNEFQVSYLPEDLIVDNDLMYYSSRFQKNNGEVLLTYQFKVKRTTIEKEDFELWRSSINKIEKNMKETVGLHKK